MSKIYKTHSRGKRINRTSTHHLTRIMIYLEEIGKPAHMSKISQDTSIRNDYIKTALAWLVKYGLIKKTMVNRNPSYYRRKK